MFGGLPLSISASLKAKVLAILDRYFAALEDGSASNLYADPAYRWKAYKDMTLDTMRAKLLDTDTYISAQRGWVGRNLGTDTIEGDPELMRLPDAALVAMFQDLDRVYAAEPLIAAQEPPAEYLGG